MKQTLAIALGLAAFVSAASPAGAEIVNFSHEGYNSQVEKIAAKDGSYRLIGKDEVSGKSYSLLVRNNHVRGRFGNSDIQFSLKAEAKELASR